MDKALQSCLKEGHDQTCPACPATFISQALQNTTNGDDPRKSYRHFPLKNSGSIRLLRLLPGDQKDGIQCQLFDFPLQETGDEPCLYEALSYAWGKLEKPKYVSIDKYQFPVTANLYVALLHLRDRFLERILWVDALCINQVDAKERAQQVQSIAKIYYKANRVIVWLGEASADSHQALEDIRDAIDEFEKVSYCERNKDSVPDTHGSGYRSYSNESQDAVVTADVSGSSSHTKRDQGATVTAGGSGNPSHSQKNQGAIVALLQRDWFQRVWVLQEVAAARHILIMCCSATIDGYAFCLGLHLLKLSYDALPDLRNLIRLVTYLIKGSICRSKYKFASQGLVSLGIRPLGELIEMYHAHKAADPRDKVYALLGMSSDDPSAAGLLPDYDIPLDHLFRNLVKFLLGRRVSVDVWDNREIAVIRGKGCILGKVSWIEAANSGRDDKQELFITSNDPSGVIGPSRHWTFQVSAKLVQVGDIICLLEGASNPTVIRPGQDCFFVIMVAITPPARKSGTAQQPEQSTEFFTHEFLLVWDWAMLKGNLQNQEYRTYIAGRVSNHPNRKTGNDSDKLNRLWNTALILEESGEYEKAEERLQGPVDDYKARFGREDLLTLVRIEKLALIHQKLTKLKEAEKAFNQVVDVRQRLQGEEHRDTISSMGNLASVLEARANQRDGKCLLAEAKNWRMLIDILEQGWEVSQKIEEELLRMIEMEEFARLRALPNFSAIQITERILIAAAEHPRHSSEIMSALLDRKREGIRITERVLITIAEKCHDSEIVMKDVLDWKEVDVQITENVLLAAARNSDKKSGDTLKFLLERKGEKVHVPKGMLSAAVINGHSHKAIKILLDKEKEKEKISVTEKMLIAAAKNKTVDTLQLLLDQREKEVQITDNVLIAAVKNKYIAKKAIIALLDKREKGVQITERVLLEATKASSKMKSEDAWEIDKLLQDHKQRYGSRWQTLVVTATTGIQKLTQWEYEDFRQKSQDFRAWAGGARYNHL